MMEMIGKRNIIRKVTVLIIVIGIGTAGMVKADGVIKILPIKPVPELLSDEALTGGHTRVVFHGAGVIDRIGNGEEGEKLVVVNDRLKYFAPSVRYYSIGGTFLSFSQFKPGKDRKSVV